MESNNDRKRKASDGTVITAGRR